MTRQERIEQYLRGRMTEAERAEFQTDLLFDPELKRELAATRDIQRAVRATEPPPRHPGMLWAGLLVVALLGGLAWWFFPVSNAEADLTEILEPTVPPQQPAQPPILDSVEVSTEPSTPSDSLLESDIRQPIPPDEPSEPNEPTTTVPIAYLPNPELERAAVNLRGLDYELTIRGPAEELPTGIALTFSGVVETEDEPPELLIHVLSNRQEDYRNRSYLRSAEVDFAEGDEEFDFSETLSLNLAPGRFYWLVEDVNEEAVIRVGWFEVR